MTQSKKYKFISKNIDSDEWKKLKIAWNSKRAFIEFLVQALELINDSFFKYR